MSNCCCKYAKWFPHNWLCLKGLSYVFLGIFYIAALLGIYQVIQILLYPIPNTLLKLQVLLNVSVIFFGTALLAWAIAKALRALRQIKQAVAPCCCESEKKEDKETK